MPVLESVRASLVVRHHSRVSGRFLPDEKEVDLDKLEVDLDKLEVDLDELEVDLDKLVEGCGRTCWLILADRTCLDSS